MAEPLAILVLPCRLEQFELADHARRLLDIPRVIALESRRPRRARRLGLLGEAAAVRHARRLRLPGDPRLIVLYRAADYPLARALGARYREAELWYVSSDAPDSANAHEFEELVRERAAAVVGTDPLPLHRRLAELEVISARPFIPPGARVTLK